MILNQSQARAIYSAMAELNTVSGKLQCRIPTPSAHTFIHVKEHSGCDIHIWFGDFGGHPISRTTERYDTQGLFAEAYGVL
jgi:hypothetical protein